MLNKRQAAVFCSQLKSLLASGMPLLEAITIIRDLPQNKKHLSQIKTIINMINDGYALSEAAVILLPTMVVGSISAAERAGNLEECLGRLAEYYNSKAELDEKLISALIYPVFVMILSLISVLVLIVFVIPGLKGLFSDMGGSLPPVTSFILNLSDLFSRFWFVFLLMFVCLAVWLGRVKRRDPAGLEKLIIKTPLIGKLYKQELMIQGFGTLGSLLSGGTPIIEALKITAVSCGSFGLKQILQNTKEAVESGRSLSAAFEAENFFPADALQMLRVGESSGQLDQMLSSIADFQAREREVLLRRVTTLIEPAMTLGVGLVVGVVVLAMFLPLVNMVSGLQ
jgi:type IV pilus assembly protein PilC